MRVQAAQVRTAGLAAAAALLAVGVSACSGGSSAGAPVTPHVALGTTASPSATPTSGASPADPGSTLASYDANAALAVKQQQIGCKAALGPLFGAVVNGSATQDRVLSVTPAAAKQAMQDTFTQLNAIMGQDANALTDGNASKASKVLDAFCLTPAGAQFVGTTPADALKPPKPVKTVPAPKPTTHHGPVGCRLPADDPGRPADRPQPPGRPPATARPTGRPPATARPTGRP